VDLSALYTMSTVVESDRTTQTSSDSLGITDWYSRSYKKRNK